MPAKKNSRKSAKGGTPAATAALLSLIQKHVTSKSGGDPMALAIQAYFLGIGSYKTNGKDKKHLRDKEWQHFLKHHAQGYKSVKKHYKKAFELKKRIVESYEGKLKSELREADEELKKLVEIQREAYQNHKHTKGESKETREAHNQLLAKALRVPAHSYYDILKRLAETLKEHNLSLWKRVAGWFTDGQEGLRSSEEIPKNYKVPHRLTKAVSGGEQEHVKFLIAQFAKFQWDVISSYAFEVHHLTSKSPAKQAEGYVPRTDYEQKFLSQVQRYHHIRRHIQYHHDAQKYLTKHGGEHKKHNGKKHNGKKHNGKKHNGKKHNGKKHEGEKHEPPKKPQEKQFPSSRPDTLVGLKYPRY